MLIFIVLFIAVLFGISIKDKRKSKIYLLCCVLFAALVCGLRDMLGGYDNYIYGEIFDNTAAELRKGVNIFMLTAFTTNPHEPGYSLFNVLIGFLTRNRYIYFLITALLYYTIIFRHIHKYSKKPATAFFLFFCFYYFFTYTYIRQFLACSICWFAIPYAANRKPIPFFLITILAATFHNSALLFGLLYFVADKNYSLRKVYIILGCSLLVGLTPMSSFLMTTIGGSVNEQKAALSANAAGNARLDYFFEGITFLFVLSKIYYKIPKDKLSICLKNMALLFIFVLLFFIRFTDGGRMSWYFLLGIVCCFSQIPSKNIDFKYLKQCAYLIFTILYFRILFAWSLGGVLTPYRTFLENADKRNDVVWAEYEYDPNYDKDNLYNLR